MGSGSPRQTGGWQQSDL